MAVGSGFGLFFRLAGGLYSSDAEAAEAVTSEPVDVGVPGSSAGVDRISDADAMAALGMPLPPAVLPPERPTDDEAMAMLGMPTSPDAAQGGGTVSDPDAAAAAAKRAKEIPSEEMVITATRSLPKIRGFTDQTFVLMHAMNLVNLRNEKVAEFKFTEELEKGNDTDVITNTVRSLKHEMPYAYFPTDSNPKERNAVIQCYGEPATFKNYITARPGYQNYLNADTKTLSTLVPKIKIYKVFDKAGRGDDGEGERAVEFVFETAGIGAAELDEMLSSKGAKRGYGVGIKSFDCSFQQGNPMIMHSIVNGKLVLYASSMDELLKPRRGGTADTSDLHYRFIDLAFRSTGEAVFNSEVVAPGPGTIDDLNFEIVFDVGVVSTSNSIGLESDYSSMSMVMGSVGHNFDIGQDGSITLTIELDGRVENRFRNKIMFDILSTKESLTYDLYTKLAPAAITLGCDSKAAAAYKQQMLSIGNSKFKERLTLVNDLLRAKGKIYYINIPSKTLEAYNDAFNAYEKTAAQAAEQEKMMKDGKTMDPLTLSKINAGFDALKNALSPYKADDEPDSSPPALDGARAVGAGIVVSIDEKHSKEMEDQMEDKPKEEQTAIRDCAIDPNSTQVAYFYAGDLINVILENLSDIYTPTAINAMVGDAINMTKDAVGNTLSGVLQGSNQAAIGTLASDAIDKKQVSKIASALKTGAADFKKYRIVLGPVLVADFFSSKKIQCSIGDIPIALNHFNAWLAGATEGKDRTRYALYDFLNEFLNEYLRSYLMGDKKYFDRNSLGRLYHFDADTIMGYAPNNLEFDTDPLTLHRTSYGGRKGLLYETIPQVDRPLIVNKPNVFLRKSKLNTHDYHIFYQSGAEYCLPTTPERMGKLGIHVYQQGKDRGIIRDMQFQRNDIEGLRTVRILNNQEGTGNEAMSQLSEIFDATITTYPNLEAFIGQKVYIAPQSITPYLSKATLDTFPNFKGLYNLDRMGIGGFYEINQVHHSFSPEKMETRIVSIQDGRWMDDKRKEAAIKDAIAAEEEAAAAAEATAAAEEKAAGLAALGGVFAAGVDEALDAAGNAATGSPLAAHQAITSEPPAGTVNCKSIFGEGPEEGPKSATRSSAEATSDTFLDGLFNYAENFVAWAKGQFDNSNDDMTEDEALGITEFSSKSDSPSSGNQKASSEGPTNN